MLGLVLKIYCKFVCNFNLFIITDYCGLMDFIVVYFKNTENLTIYFLDMLLCKTRKQQQQNSPLKNWGGVGGR